MNQRLRRKTTTEQLSGGKSSLKPMNTLEHLRHLYKFNVWANGVILKNVRASKSVKCTKYLAHVLITEDEYFERLRDKDSTGFNFWPDLTIDECESLAAANSKQFGDLLNEIGEEGLENKASYKTSEGEPYLNTFREVFTHVLFHSMNHRGQILTLLRNEGFQPPEIDYIVFERIHDREA